jgi:hypothetical protein
MKQTSAAVDLSECSRGVHFGVHIGTPCGLFARAGVFAEICMAACPPSNTLTAPDLSPPRRACCAPAAIKEKDDEERGLFNISFDKVTEAIGIKLPFWSGKKGAAKK